VILDTILRIARDLAAEGVTDDELERAREPVLTAIRQSVRDNGYWLNAVLSRAQSQPRYLDYARDREADIRSVTVADLDTLVRQYLDESRAAQFIITPAPAAPEAAPPTPPPASMPTLPPAPAATAGN